MVSKVEMLYGVSMPRYIYLVDIYIYKYIFIFGRPHKTIKKIVQNIFVTAYDVIQKTIYFKNTYKYF
jgi:hypothetical protein